MIKREATEAQLASIKDLYDGNPDGSTTLEEFTKRFAPRDGVAYVGGTYCGMYIGIETDGYAHS